MSEQSAGATLKPIPFIVADTNISTQKVWEKPPSYNGQYHKVQATTYRCGHQTEVDQTPGAERLRVMHKNGSYVEMHADGTFQIRSNGNTNVVTIGDNSLKVSGKYDVEIGAGSNIKIIGNCNLEVTGNLNSKVGGNWTCNVVGNFDMKIGGTSTMESGGNMTKKAPRIDLNP